MNRLVVLTILFLLFSPLVFFFLYLVFRLIKCFKTKKLFDNGTTNVKATIYENFEGYRHRGGRFYIVRAKYIDIAGKEYKYRSKRLSKRPEIKIGDNVDVTVALTNFSAYKFFEI